MSNIIETLRELQHNYSRKGKFLEAKFKLVKQVES